PLDHLLDHRLGPVDQLLHRHCLPRGSLRAPDSLHRRPRYGARLGPSSEVGPTEGGSPRWPPAPDRDRVTLRGHLAAPLPTLRGAPTGRAPSCCPTRGSHAVDLLASPAPGPQRLLASDQLASAPRRRTGAVLGGGRCRRAAAGCRSAGPDAAAALASAPG